jgi:hypothetical protein
MNKVIRGFLIFCVLINGLYASAQVEVVKQKRFEHNGAVATSVAPNNKVITYSIISEKGEDDQLEIVAYDEKLEEEGRFQVKCSDRNIFKTHSISGTGEYYFSLMIDKGREIHSVVFNTNTLEGTELRVPLERKFEPNGNLDFFGGSSTRCFKNKFFILGTVKNVPCILVYNMLTGTQHITFIPGMDKNNRVSFLSTVEAAPSIQVMYFHSKPKKIDAQYIVSINEFGEIEGKPVSIMAQKEKLLIDGNVTWVDEHTSLICGATGEKSSIAKGMYILEIKDGEIIRRNDYNFNDFKDFYSLLNEKTQKKIEKKKSKKKNFESQCYMVTHPVVFSDKTWTVVGEVFYPTYRTETQTSYVNGKTVTRTVQVFDGFQYTHAVVLQVDEELEKIKDFTFELEISENPMSPKKYIRTAQAGSQLNFYYVDVFNFGHASIEDGELEVSPLVDIVDDEKDLKDSEKVTNRISSNVKYWYKDFYLITDTFRSKDSDESIGNKRKMYVQFKKIKIE